MKIIETGIKICCTAKYSKYRIVGSSEVELSAVC